MMLKLCLILLLVTDVDKYRAMQPSIAEPVMESSVTEDPLTALESDYIKKSNVNPYLIHKVITQVGQTVYLHCNVNLEGDKTVSWIRIRDFTILTVGNYTYTSDTRFQSVYMHISNDWVLQIKDPQLSDEGLYECKVSSFPPKSTYFRLLVVDVDKYRATEPSSIEPMMESRVTEDPLATLQSKYKNKSNVDPYLTRNVTTQVGQTVYLHCIANLEEDRIVSWIRLRDLKILTVGKYTYTSDTRFQSMYMPTSNDSVLEIKDPQLSDKGLYECKVSSFPPKSIYIRLFVVVPQARILEGPELYVDVGSSINLTCVIVDSPEPPAFVSWYQDGRMINYDFIRGSITVEKGGDNTAVSSLRIKNAQLYDSGNYTCEPSNADSVSTIVYVGEGDKQPAVENIEDSAAQSSTDFMLMFLFLMLLL